LPGDIQHTEEELVSLLKQKSKEGFDYLYKQYAGVLYGIVRKVVTDEQTAQDVLQDAFVKIWHNIDRFDPAKGRIYTWMMNIARNTAIDKLRSKGELMKSRIQEGNNIVYTLEHGLKTEQKIDTIGLNRLIEGLKPEYQAIINLAYFKGFTLDEISKTLDVPLGTVKTRMRHAIQLLRANFSQ
jgi:RNA polymerase sigma factor (sigma-70 family)